MTHPTPSMSPRHIFVLLAVSLTLTACGDPAEETSSTPSGADMAMVEEMSPPMDMGGVDMEEDAGVPPTSDMETPETQDMGEALLEIPDEPFDITQRGPYNVGVHHTSFSFMREPDDAERTLDVVFWYPSREPEGLYTQYVDGFLTRRVDYVFEDLTIADTKSAYPMMVFSHGNGSIAEQNYYMTEYFASHGWIVVAPYHTNNTVFDTEGAINYASAIDRPQDIRALLDWIETDLPQRAPVRGHIDMEHIIMSGHSFGGLTTLANAGATFAVDEMVTACEQGTVNQDYCEIFEGDAVLELFRGGFGDPRIKAAIPQTPGVWEIYRDGLANIDIPTLVMTAGRDMSLPNDTQGDPIWAEMQGPHARFDLPNGGHFTYTNMCELFGGLEIAAEDGCDDTFVPFETVAPMINVYSMAFARYHLFDDQAHEALVEGTERPYDSDILIYTTK